MAIIDGFWIQKWQIITFLIVYDSGNLDNLTNVKSVKCRFWAILAVSWAWNGGNFNIK